jgi:hypothetical protein
MGWECSLDDGDKECILNFGRETFWKIAFWMTDKEWEDNI